MTIRDLLYSCGNLNKKTKVTVITANGGELASHVPVSYIHEQPEILSSEVDYFKVFVNDIIILV